MVTDNFIKIDWKNGITENPTYIIAANLNSINVETKKAFDELEKRLLGDVTDNANRPIISVYQSLNLLPSSGNDYTNAINPVGRASGVIGNYSIGLGYNNLANGINAIAIGKEVHSTADDTITIGTNDDNSGIGAIQIGRTMLPSSDYSINIGYVDSRDNNEVSGEASIAIGKNAKAIADKSIQLGEGTNNTENSLQVLGQNIFRTETTIDTDNLTTTITNTFGGPESENASTTVINNFAGNATGATTTLGAGENLRNIEDIFEPASTTVKKASTADTKPISDRSTNIATTQFVHNAVSDAYAGWALLATPETYYYETGVTIEGLTSTMMSLTIVYYGENITIGCGVFFSTVLLSTGAYIPVNLNIPTNATNNYFVRGDDSDTFYVIRIYKYENGEYAETADLTITAVYSSK